MNLKILIFLLVAIGLDDAYGSIIVLSGLEESQTIQAVLVGILYGSQIVFSPLQAGFSDFSCRRTGLLIAFCVTFVSLILLFFHVKFFYIFLLLAALIKGIGGNIIPIARASLADTVKHNFRFAIGLSTSAIAIGFIFTTILGNRLSNLYLNILLVISLVVLFLFGFKIFYDKSDKDRKDKPATLWEGAKREIYTIYNDFLKNKLFLMSGLSYYFWELSFYIVFIGDVDMENSFFKHYSLAMCLGYLSGVVLLRFIRKSDPHVLRWGYNISISSIVLVFISYFVGIKVIALYLPIISYFFYSLGFGFFVPCLFSMVSKTRALHEQGKIYGLIDAFDGAAFTTAILLDVYLKSFKITIFLSFLFLLIGVLIYNLSRNHWRPHEKKIYL